MAYLWLAVPIIVALAIGALGSCLAFGWRGMAFVMSLTLALTVLMVLLAWQAGQIWGGIICGG